MRSAGPDVGPLTSVTAAGPDDIWASNAFGEFGGRVAHWDGTQWSEVSTTPIPQATHVGVARVAASPAGDVWAIGYWGIYDGAGGWDVFQDHIQHFTPDCIGDTNGDGAVDTNDFLALLAAWGSCPACPEDLDANGAVDTTDLLMLLANWT